MTKAISNVFIPVAALQIVQYKINVVEEGGEYASEDKEEMGKADLDSFNKGWRESLGSGAGGVQTASCGAWTT